MDIIETKTVRTEISKRLDLTGGDIQRLVEQALGIELPARAEIFFQVPGGADWSNTAINICKDTPVTISWTEVTFG